MFSAPVWLKVPSGIKVTWMKRSVLYTRDNMCSIRQKGHVEGGVISRNNQNRLPVLGLEELYLPPCCTINVTGYTAMSDVIDIISFVQFFAYRLEAKGGSPR